VSADVEVSHKFVVAPNTLPIDEWLATKGQSERNEWPERQQQRKPEEPTISRRRSTPSPSRRRRGRSLK
jgi:hypothetical protein